VEVVVPSWARTRHLREFLQQAGPWIRRKAALLEERSGTVVPEPCQAGGEVMIDGQPRPLRVESRAGSPGVRFGDEVVVRLPPGPVDSLHDRTRKALVAALRDQVRETARTHIETYAPRLGVTPRGLRIKSQKTLWGSCGPTGLININWRLVGAPPEVLEYIVVHELCHLRERNHAPRFWALVAAQMPDYPRHRGWLKENGLRLG